MTGKPLAPVAAGRVTSGISSLKPMLDEMENFYASVFQHAGDDHQVDRRAQRHRVADPDQRAVFLHHACGQQNQRVAR